jgi:hypothetical protein
MRLTALLYAYLCDIFQRMHTNIAGEDSRFKAAPNKRCTYVTDWARLDEMHISNVSCVHGPGGVISGKGPGQGVKILA